MNKSDGFNITERLMNSEEIYNEEMSPTSVCVAYDTVLEKVYVLYI